MSPAAGPVHARPRDLDVVRSATRGRRDKADDEAPVIIVAAAEISAGSRLLSQWPCVCDFRWPPAKICCGRPSGPGGEICPGRKLIKFICARPHSSRPLCSDASGPRRQSRRGGGGGKCHSLGWDWSWEETAATSLVLPASCLAGALKQSAGTLACFIHYHFH